MIELNQKYYFFHQKINFLYLVREVGGYGYGDGDRREEDLFYQNLEEFPRFLGEFSFLFWGNFSFV
jgi:hypothetical protein